MTARRRTRHIVCGLLIAVHASSGPTLAAATDPESDCAMLAAQQQATVALLRAEAAACTARQSSYAQARYAHQAGAGACAMRVVGQCRPLVERCSRALADGDAAVRRCRERARAR